MEINFFKYQGAGNDFVIIDNRSGTLHLTHEQVALLCHRRFGIGADGLMLLQSEPGFDYRMLYYNADGLESTMCGNGGRCIAAFAYHIGAAGKEQHFMAIDGPHQAIIIEDGEVKLQMTDVQHIEYEEDATILNTGSPHYVHFTSHIDQIDVDKEGRRIRNLERFQPKGINVNFASYHEDHIKIRTYERGVEAETLACGTGVTAVAIVAACGKTGHIHTKVQALGGMLSVSFEKIDNQTVKNIWLQGPAKMVFKGSINC